MNTPLSYQAQLGWKSPANRLAPDPTPMGHFLGMPIPSGATWANMLLNYTGNKLLPVGDADKMRRSTFVAPDRALRIPPAYAALVGMSRAPATDLSQSILARLGRPEYAETLRGFAADPSIAAGFDPRTREILSRI